MKVESKYKDEVWKKIDFCDEYMVSNFGRIKHNSGYTYSTRGKLKREEKIISYFINNGKRAVRFYKNKKKYTRNVDYLVADAFIQNLENKPFIIHKDKNIENNNYYNLEWSFVQQKVYDKDINLAIDDYFKNKSTLKNVSKKFGISATKIKTEIINNGFKVRGQADLRKISNEEINEIISKCDVLDKNELAKKLNRNKATIQKHVKLNGLKIKRLKHGHISKDIKETAKNMYFNDKLSALQVSKKLNISNVSVSNIVGKDNMRSQSETTALVYISDNYIYNSKRCTVETKFGKLKTDSSYELTRLRQLECDLSIKNVSRCTFSIPYFYDKNRRYIPDFLIEYNDGTIVIEEIKPNYKLSDKQNIEKFLVGEKYCLDNGYKFRVVTEDVIYAKK